ADVPESFLQQQKLAKGKVTLVDFTRITTLRKFIKSACSLRAGGAASNSIAGIASFGGTAAFMGKVAYDEIGRLFNDDLEKLDVRYPTEPLTAEGATTGMCFSFVTPDAGRTMCTYLGASVEFSPDDVDAKVIEDSNILYLEGYMLDQSKTKLALHAAADI